MKDTLIIGLDCATKDRKCGLAKGILDSSGLKILEVHLPTGKEKAAHKILDWLENVDCGLIAIDAPLGWPITLSRALANHRAGDRILATDFLMSFTTIQRIRV